MVEVTLHYWAGARAAAGVESEVVSADSVAAALERARSRRNTPYFDRVLSVSSALIDGVVVHPEEYGAILSGPVRVEILPPFAGGGQVPAVADLTPPTPPDPTYWILVSSNETLPWDAGRAHLG